MMTKLVHARYGQLVEWSKQNWLRLTDGQRAACLDRLHGWIDKEHVVWLRDHWNNPGFHMFGGGMQVRNRLRDALSDDDLPLITKSPSGQPYRSKNWDDYYIGAVHAFLDCYDESGDRKP